MIRRINAAGLALVKEFEGFEPRWYPDPAHGWKVPTIGYGHTDAAGNPKYATNKGLVLSEADATDILRNDVQKYADAVSKAVKVPLNDNQFDALVSFTYNLGPGNLNKSTLLKKLNAGDYDGAANEFGKWVKAGGKTLNGLVRRRKAEAALFRAPVSTLTKPANASPDPSVGQRAPVSTGAKAAVVGIATALAAIGAWFGDLFERLF